MKKLAVLFSMFALLGLSSCAENAAATAKCKEGIADAEACSKCCTANGASGNTYSGSGCTCRGGG